MTCAVCVFLGASVVIISINRSVYIDEETKEFSYLRPGKKSGYNSEKCLISLFSNGHMVPLYDVTAP